MWNRQQRVHVTLEHRRWHLIEEADTLCGAVPNTTPFELHPESGRHVRGDIPRDEWLKDAGRFVFEYSAGKICGDCLDVQWGSRRRHFKRAAAGS
jgi:hypothetical protein